MLIGLLWAAFVPAATFTCAQTDPLPTDAAGKLVDLESAFAVRPKTDTAEQVEEDARAKLAARLCGDIDPKDCERLPALRPLARRRKQRNEPCRFRKKAASSSQRPRAG